MGRINSTGKLASAFRGQDGITYYALFEESYEANLYSNSPQWECIGFGDLRETIKQIFRHASNCESGALRINGKPPVTTEYISQWLNEMESPMVLPEQGITLEVTSEFDSSIPKNDLPKVLEVLTSIGRGDLAQQLTAGDSVSITLHSEPQIVSKLYNGYLMSAWRVLKTAPDGNRDPQLGYAPKAVIAPPVTTPKFMKLNADLRLEEQHDGRWIIAGWEFHVIGKFIASLGEVELIYPGTYMSRIKSFRKAVSDAPMVPKGTVAIIDMDVPLESRFDDRRRQQLIDVQGAHLGLLKTDRGYEMSLPRNGTDAHLLTSLAPTCLNWVIPGITQDHAKQFA